MESPPHPYRLLDAGEGRRLEWFGQRLVDRPAPGAFEAPAAPASAWAAADLRFERSDGWTGPGAPWEVEVDGLRLELRPTPSGQVGWFPEHRLHWPWLREQLAGRPGAEVLHLFAYTGATTLVLVAAGAAVVHVDGSRPTVAWARANSAASGLADAPVRWIVDDVDRFVSREARRGRRYAGIVLDPPSYGHGPDGRRWEASRGLDGLLERCAAVAAPGAFVLLTSHAGGVRPEDLGGAMRAAFGRPAAEGPLRLDAESGAVLELGAFGRIAAGR